MNVVLFIDKPVYIKYTVTEEKVKGDNIMEKKLRLQQVMTVLLAVLIVINLFMVMSLKERLDDINFSVNNKLQQIESDIKSANYDFQNIKEDIEDDIGLVTSFDFSYGELDRENLTVPVRSRIVPKSLSGDTALFLEFAGRTVEMKKEETSSVFVADFTVGLFEQKEEENVRLVIKNGDVFETVELDWNFAYIHTDFLPFLVVHFIFDDITFSEKTGIKVEGRLSGFIDDEDTDRFSDLRLIYKINGEIVSAETVGIDNIDLLNINKTFPGYGVGDIFEFYAEATDEFGFIHESLLKRVEFSKNGESTEETAEADETYSVIRDKDGNVLAG